jgi:ATP-dependent Clp protease ATP-binding subunit ClpA
MGLVGYEKSYQGAKPGTMTGFVKEQPHSILLFDEIEKAHLNTIHLFLHDSGRGQAHGPVPRRGRFFKDTIIIFTSNAGRSLYEGTPSKTPPAFRERRCSTRWRRKRIRRPDSRFFPRRHLQPHGDRMAAAVQHSAGASSGKDQRRGTEPVLRPV